MNSIELAQRIDHTLLKPESTRKDIEKICAEAAQYRFKTVCIQPSWIKFAASILTNLDAKDTVPISVVGFPHGANRSETKAFETTLAIQDGAQEIDMVIALGALKDANWIFVEKDIRCVVQAAVGKPVKVILETCLLSAQEIQEACKIAENSGAAFVKTSTGFNGAGATLEAVRLMHSSVSDKVQVKASGGIRDLKTALAFIEAGASRLGTSSGVAILEGLASTADY